MLYIIGMSTVGLLVASGRTSYISYELVWWPIPEKLDIKRFVLRQIMWWMIGGSCEEEHRRPVRNLYDDKCGWIRGVGERREEEAESDLYSLHMAYADSSFSVLGVRACVVRAKGSPVCLAYYRWWLKVVAEIKQLLQQMSWVWLIPHRRPHLY